MANMTPQELEKWEKELKERDKGCTKWENTLQKQQDGLDKKEGDLLELEKQLREEKRKGRSSKAPKAAEPATQMPCPRCNEPADLTPGEKGSIISICGQGHKHTHGVGLMKKLRDQAQVRAREAVKAFPCPTCTNPAKLVNDPDSDDGTAISECDAGHRHVLSNSRRKSLGIPVG